ncbi:MAG: head GIN domain-containing protein [Bacteroidota bacterium]
MKKILFILFLLPALGYANCDKDHVKGNGTIKSESRNLNSFNKISTGGSIDIVIEQGFTESAEITTDENLMSYIITEVKDNTLSIHFKENVSISSTKLIVKVNCKELRAISAGGSGDVKTAGVLKADKLEISQGGSGDFKLNLNVSKLEISKAGSGDFKLEGKIADLELSSAGSGNLDASKTTVGDAEISMAGSGDVVLPKGTKPKVSSVGSGDVHYE